MCLSIRQSERKVSAWNRNEFLRICMHATWKCINSEWSKWICDAFCASHFFGEKQKMETSINIKMEMNVITRTHLHLCQSYQFDESSKNLHLECAVQFAQTHISCKYWGEKIPPSSHLTCESKSWCRIRMVWIAWWKSNFRVLHHKTVAQWERLYHNTEEKLDDSV